MDNQKQIEEMKTHIKSALSGVLEIEIDKLAEELLKHYQPKIPENAVVLTKEEYEKLKKFEYRVQSGVCMTQKEWFDFCNEDSNRRTCLRIEEREKERKETEEKFAEMLKEKLKELELGGWVEVETKCFNKIVDEICKNLRRARNGNCI